MMKKGWMIIAVILVFMGGYASFAYFSVPPSAVADQMQTASTVCDSLEASNKRMACWEKELVPIVSRAGIRPVLDEIEKTFIASDSAQTGGITRCHDITHGVGRVAGKTTHDLQQSFAQCTNLCGYGCFMGIVDGYMAQGEDFTKHITDVCSHTDQPWPCSHALGHVVGNRTGDVVAGLTYCDALEDKQERQQCTSGVFMELFDSPNFTGHGTVPVAQDVPGFCESLWGDHKEYCYTQAGYLTYLREQNIPKSIALCSTFHPATRMACLQLFATEMYYRFNGSAEGLRDFCQQLPLDAQTSCIEGILVKSVISDPIARHGFEFCAILEGSERSHCFAYLGDVIEGNERELGKRERLCSGLSSEDASFCLGER